MRVGVCVSEGQTIALNNEILKKMPVKCQPQGLLNERVSHGTAIWRRVPKVKVKVM